MMAAFYFGVSSVADTIVFNPAAAPKEGKVFGISTSYFGVADTTLETPTTRYLGMAPNNPSLFKQTQASAAGLKHLEVS